MVASPITFGLLATAASFAVVAATAPNPPVIEKVKGAMLGSIRTR
jgi:hypothetical protein